MATSFIPNKRVTLDGSVYTVQTAGKDYSITTPMTDSIRFEVRSGDVWSAIDSANLNRSEIASAMQVANGSPVHVSYVMNIDPGAANPNAWTVLGQFHQDDRPDTPAAAPPFSIQLHGEKMEIRIGFTGLNGETEYRSVFTDTANIVRGKDYAIDIQAVFDPKGNGHLVITRDGAKIVDYSGPLGYTSQQSVYWKEGIYRPQTDTTMAVTYSDRTVSTGDPVATQPIRTSAPIVITQYDPNGHAVSTSTEYADGSTKIDLLNGTGAITRSYTTQPDGSREMTTYQITGKDYATEHSVTNAAGKYVLIERYDADGTLQYKQSTDTSGVLTNFKYDASGQLVQKGVTAANGAREIVDYGVTGKAYASADTTYDQYGKMLLQTRYRADGSVESTTQNRPDWSAVTNSYDMAGRLMTKTVVWSNNMKDVYQYNVAGQNYTSNHVVYDASGKALSLEQFNAQGQLVYTTAFNANAKSLFYTYDSDGHMTSQTTTWAASGMKQINQYHVVGESYTSTSQMSDATGKVVSFTRYHDDGTLDFAYTLGASGTATSISYDASGTMLRKSIAYTNGTRDLYDYNANGTVADHINYNAAGKAVLFEEFKADGSKQVQHFEIAGKTYASDKIVYDAAGKLVALTQYHADGTLDYAQTIGKAGESIASKYDATGHLTQSVTSYLDGSREISQFGIIGQKYVAAHYLYDTAGNLSHVDQTMVDGSIRSADYGIVNKSYVSEIVTRRDGVVVSDERYHADGTMDYLRTVNADGSSKEIIYDAAGKMVQAVTTKADGSLVAAAYGDHAVITSGAGSDYLTGYQNGTFVFGVNFGKDTITNFNTGANHDTIKLDKSLAADFDHLNLKQVGSDTVITITPHDTITLKGVALTSLQANDFLFV